jgi:hypothetical protein
LDATGSTEVFIAGPELGKTEIAGEGMIVGVELSDFEEALDGSFELESGD